MRAPRRVPIAFCGFVHWLERAFYDLRINIVDLLLIGFARKRPKKPCAFGHLFGPPHVAADGERFGVLRCAEEPSEFSHLPHDDVSREGDVLGWGKWWERRPERHSAGDGLKERAVFDIKFLDTSYGNGEITFDG